MAVWNDQERRFADFLDAAHVGFAKGQGAEDCTAIATKTDDGHSPGKFPQRHGYVAFDRNDAFIDRLDPSVRQDFPFLVEARHAIRTFRADNSQQTHIAPKNRDRLTFVLGGKLPLAAINKSRLEVGGDCARSKLHCHPGCCASRTSE